MKTKWIILAFAIMLGLSVQSCREMGINPWDMKGHGGGNDTSKANLTIEQLVGTKWQLTSIVRSTQNGTQSEIQPVPKEQFISLGFDNRAKISGQNICNSYSANILRNAGGGIDFTNIVSTKVYCGDGMLDGEYLIGLDGAFSYSATGRELRINYKPEVSIPETGVRTLVFARLSNQDENSDADDIIKQFAGRSYTLYSFVNANVEELVSSKKCTLAVKPSYLNLPRRGYASILAECNKGNADVLFSMDAKQIKFENIVLTKMVCENQMLADRFVEFLRNTGSFEFSDNGRTLTIWSSLQTFAESKIVLKLTPVIIPSNTIDIQETPSSGVPVSTYQSFILREKRFDGKYIQLAYQYNGRASDYRISAYSTFEFRPGMPPSVAVDLVTEGSPNIMSSLTPGNAVLTLDAIRKHIITASPIPTKMIVVLRWNSQILGEVEVLL
ncbi:MAG: META domain-containing protein [Ignavibacteriae bacterium]|nr:META domain-containing protein [Ignavibacteriota bacterium]